MGQAASAHGIAQQERRPRESVSIVLSEEVLDRLIGRPETMKEPEREPDPKFDPRNYRQVDFSDFQQIDNPALVDQESEFTKNKNYWKKRLEDLQEVHERIKQVLETEKDRGFKDVQVTLPRTEDEKGEKPCVDSLTEVADCYKTNPQEPLVCDKEVSNFVSCLRDKRMEMLSEKKEDS
uniref:CHCH domain-containing protein n=1 Tax=Graphocephala atropunctata TaxID=36148 RepID=A0A1B6K9M9_9HEMI